MDVTTASPAITNHEVIGARALLLDLRRVHGELQAVTTHWARAYSHAAAVRKHDLGIEHAALVRAYSLVTHTPEPAVAALLAA